MVRILNQAIIALRVLDGFANGRAFSAITFEADQLNEAGVRPEISFTISAESSVEPSSTTMISRVRPAGSGGPDARSRIVPTYSSSLKSGIRMDTRVAGILRLLHSLSISANNPGPSKTDLRRIFVGEIVADHAVLIDQEQMRNIDVLHWPGVALK